MLPQHDIHTSAGTPHSSKTLPIDIKAICPITSVPIESLLLGSSKVLNDNGASVSHSPTRTSAAAATPSMSAPAALVLHHPLIDANEGQVGSFSSLSTVTEESSDGEEEEGVEVQLASKLSVRSSKLNSSVVSTFLEHDMNDNDKERDSDAHSRRGSRRRSSSNSSSCTSASSDVIGCGGLVMNSSSSAEWLQGRDPSFYPADPFLPWHFCWVDDGMIGGCSAPVKRYHWKALADANVGLVVNLTETPITPAKTNRSTSRVILTTTNESNHHEDNDGSDEQFYFDEASGLVLDKASHKPVAGNRKSPCSRCEYVHEIFDEDLFDGKKKGRLFQV